MPNVKKSNATQRGISVQNSWVTVSVDGPIDLCKRVGKWDHKAHSCTA